MVNAPVLAVSEDYFKAYSSKYVFTSKNHYYRKTVISRKRKGGWRVISEHIHPDNGVTVVMAK